MEHAEKIANEAHDQFRWTLDACPDGILYSDDRVTDVETRNEEGKVIVRHPDGDFELAVVYKKLRNASS
jgi:hypothetical protein